MKGLIEGAVAGGVALALHFGAFAMIPTPKVGSSDAAGDGGVALVSLSAANPSLTARVAAWENPPTLVQPEGLVAPLVADVAPVMPLKDAAALMVDAPKLAAAAPKDPAPSVDAPPAEPAPVKEPALDKVAPVAPAAQKPQAAQQESRPAQKAAGKGKAQAAGTTGQAAAATADGAKTQALAAQWGAAIRARIERRKTYPASAGRAAGTVTLRLQVGADGRLAGVAVVTSSGNAALDAAAIRAVKSAGRLPKAPAGLGTSPASFTLPLRFER